MMTWSWTGKSNSVAASTGCRVSRMSFRLGSGVTAWMVVHQDKGRDSHEPGRGPQNLTGVHERRRQRPARHDGIGHKPVTAFRKNTPKCSRASSGSSSRAGAATASGSPTVRGSALVAFPDDGEPNDTDGVVHGCAVAERRCHCSRLIGSPPHPARGMCPRKTRYRTVTGSRRRRGPAPEGRSHRPRGVVAARKRGPAIIRSRLSVDSRSTSGAKCSGA
jgi:hypothetical protein